MGELFIVFLVHSLTQASSYGMQRQQQFKVVTNKRICVIDTRDWAQEVSTIMVFMHDPEKLFYETVCFNSNEARA